ncbi:MAG TPA: histidine--tRNA ligase [Vicinamibacterales bacterium]|nr:histidine--tRNA ligase [Vicinamibacterales bacterium]HPW20946.1 histidine--tRNA ligase [Vicinamibacterales bacterium]
MIPAIRGTHDILPGEVERWQRAEDISRRLFERYGYAEVRTPIIEREELFAKGTGETTDIVQKEMYAFTDKGGERVTLRPEATPSLVRAFVEHALEQRMAAPKVYLFGPMFRYERPQKGRYRQFHQLDVEVFGMADPAIDAEVVDLAWALVAALGIVGAELVVNSVGCPACRPAFAAALVAALGADVSRLCRDCQRRAQTNPLRIFDCKVPADQPVIDALPHSLDFLCDGCRTHFAAVERHLGMYGIPYRVSHRLVRGLDYYTRTTFEILAGGIGAQNALLGGGRYDGLFRQLGGPDRTGIGFAAGLERLVLAMPEPRRSERRRPLFVAYMGEAARDAALALLRDLRRAELEAHMEYEGRSLKAQMKRADRLRAAFTLILGEEELAAGEVSVKDMATGGQRRVRREAVVEECRALVNGGRE